jgi:hypothetical protein
MGLTPEKPKSSLMAVGSDFALSSCKANTMEKMSVLSEVPNQLDRLAFNISSCFGLQRGPFFDNQAFARAVLGTGS